MRLIDAYTLQDQIQRSKINNPHKDAKVAENHVFEHEHFIKMVVMQPTAQEEIIRCKECEHGEPHTNYRGEHGILCCNARGSTNGYVHDVSWYCADGEKEVKWE